MRRACVNRFVPQRSPARAPHARQHLDAGIAVAARRLFHRTTQDREPQRDRAFVMAVMVVFVLVLMMLVFMMLVFMMLVLMVLVFTMLVFMMLVFMMLVLMVLVLGGAAHLGQASKVAPA